MSLDTKQLALIIFGVIVALEIACAGIVLVLTGALEPILLDIIRFTLTLLAGVIGAATVNGRLAKTQ